MFRWRETSNLRVRPYRLFTCLCTIRSPLSVSLWSCVSFFYLSQSFTDKVLLTGPSTDFWTYGLVSLRRRTDNSVVSFRETLNSTPSCALGSSSQECRRYRDKWKDLRRFGLLRSLQVLRHLYWSLGCGKRQCRESPTTTYSIEDTLDPFVYTFFLRFLLFSVFIINLSSPSFFDRTTYSFRFVYIYVYIRVRRH